MQPLDRFNIHEALVSDDLHQLGGVYQHLLQCIGVMGTENHGFEAIMEIRDR